MKHKLNIQVYENDHKDDRITYKGKIHIEGVSKDNPITSHDAIGLHAAGMESIIGSMRDIIVDCEGDETKLAMLVMQIVTHSIQLPSDDDDEDSKDNDW